MDRRSDHSRLIAINADQVSCQTKLPISCEGLTHFNGSTPKGLAPFMSSPRVSSCLALECSTRLQIIYTSRSLMSPCTEVNTAFLLACFRRTRLHNSSTPVINISHNRRPPAPKINSIRNSHTLVVNCHHLVSYMLLEPWNK